MASGWQAAIASAPLEARLGLVQLNFDFALMKRDAPEAYKDIEQHISPKRKTAAEDGTIHKTAQRLGTLFRGVLPKTPALIKAYGLRGGEISKSLSTNAKPSHLATAFHEYAGLDSTSLLAAATSSDQAIALHLLACMLARMFDAGKAVAVWQEFISARKQRILDDENDELQRPFNYAIAALEVQQKHLEEWDNSARSWLAAADKLKALALKQTQLRLILDNIGVVLLLNQSSLYESVLSSWQTALRTMDSMIKGSNYAVTDGAILTAISAWHLYPDMIVLGKTNQLIKQSDALLSAAGCLTVGLKGKGSEDTGVYWSLPLSYLRFYGPAVDTIGILKATPERLSLDQFLFAILGAAFRCWNVPPHEFEIGIRLIVFYGKHCFGDDLTDFSALLYSSGCRPKWLVPFAYISHLYHRTPREERSQIDKIMLMGYRKYKLFSNYIFPEDRGTQILFLGNLRYLEWTADRESWIKVAQASFKSVPKHIANGILIHELHKSGNGHVDYWETLFPIQVEGEAQPKRLRWKTVVGIARQYSVQPIEDPDILLREVSWNDVSFGYSGKTVRWNNCPRELARTFDNSHFGVASYDLVGIFPGGIELFRPDLPDAPPGPILLSHCSLSTKDMLSLFEANVFSLPEIQKYHQFPPQDHGIERSLSALIFISKLYVHLSGASIATSIFDNGTSFLDFRRDLTLNDSRMSSRPSMSSSTDNFSSKGPFRQEFCGLGDVFPSKSLSRTDYYAMAFSFLAMFELGEHHGISMKNVFAISVNDSIYVVDELFRDPSDRSDDRGENDDNGDDDDDDDDESGENNYRRYAIGRIFGNIGQSGLTILIPPSSPQIRESKAEEWDVIPHVPFDGKWENNFTNTSLHLSFTGYEVPAGTMRHGNRFTAAKFIEAAVSVHEAGVWVADLDVRHCIGLNRKLARLPVVVCSCPPSSQDQKKKEEASKEHDSSNSSNTANNISSSNDDDDNKAAGDTNTDGDTSSSLLVPDRLTSIDNWSELLELPQGGSVVRAHGNWAARLATSIVSRMRGNRTVVFGKDRCWTCAHRLAAGKRNGGGAGDDVNENGVDGGNVDANGNGDEANNNSNGNVGSTTTKKHAPITAVYIL